MATIVSDRIITLQATTPRLVAPTFWEVIATLDNIASDNILSKGEKSSVLQSYTVIINEQAGIDTQATNYGITTEKTTYDNAITALTAYLGTLTGWNVIPGEDIVIDGPTFRLKFTTVYEAKQALLNMIAQLADVSLDNIANDNVLSKGEKPNVVLAYNTIIAEQPGIDAQATSYSITTEKLAYDNAVTALTNYLGTIPGWNVMPGDDIAISGTTFRTKFQDVYTTKQTLLDAINAKIKTVTDALNSSLTAKLNKASTDILTGAITVQTSGGIRTGTLDWNTSTGVITTGTGVAITANGIVGALNGTAKFTLGTDGSANFAGTLTAASGTFGNLEVTTAGGIKTGTVTWDANGNVTGGTGVAITSKGLTAVSSGTPTFTLDAATGSATFSGNVNTGGYILCTGSVSYSGGTEYASVYVAPTSTTVNAIVGIASGVDQIGVYGRGVGTSKTSYLGQGVVARNTVGGHALGIDGTIIMINSGATTGGQSPIGMANKPGTTNGSGGTWIPIWIAGVRHWIPAWLD